MAASSFTRVSPPFARARKSSTPYSLNINGLATLIFSPPVCWHVHNPVHPAGYPR